MTPSRYRGTKRFDGEQLVFMVETVLIGALDRIQAGLPDSTNWKDRTANNQTAQAVSWYEHGALEAAGMTLAVLYAQLTDDGLAIGDALTCADNFLEACENLVQKSWYDEGEAVQTAVKAMTPGMSYPEMYNRVYPGIWPDTRKHAEAFVDRVFKDYLERP
jgi:hypothetical protein